MFCGPLQPPPGPRPLRRLAAGCHPTLPGGCGTITGPAAHPSRRGMRRAGGGCPRSRPARIALSVTSPPGSSQLPLLPPFRQLPAFVCTLALLRAMPRSLDLCHPPPNPPRAVPRHCTPSAPHPHPQSATPGTAPAPVLWCLQEQPSAGRPQVPAGRSAAPRSAGHTRFATAWDTVDDVTQRSAATRQLGARGEGRREEDQKKQKRGRRRGGRRSTTGTTGSVRREWVQDEGGWEMDGVHAQ